MPHINEKPGEEPVPGEPHDFEEISPSQPPGETVPPQDQMPLPEGAQAPTPPTPPSPPPAPEDPLA
jgi:hypothetical protein